MRCPYSIFRSASNAALFLFLGFAALAFVSMTGCGRGDGGHVVGNGGDEVLAGLNKGREHARGVLNWVTTARLQRTGGELDSDDEYVLDETNKKEILKELAEVPVEVVHAFPSFCKGEAAAGAACTVPEKGATIYALRSRCERLNLVELGELMLHETLHHFLGADERRIYRLAGRLYRGFSDVSAYHLPRGVRQVVPSANGGAAAIWDGRSLLSWNPYHDKAIGRFSPGEGWSETELSPAPWWIAKSEKKDKDAGTANDVMLYAPTPDVAYAFFYRTGFDRSLGMFADFDVRVETKTGKWIPLYGDKRAPRWGLINKFNTGGRVRYVASPDRFVVVATDTKKNAHVAIFDPKTEAWVTKEVKLPENMSLEATVLSGPAVRLIGHLEGNSPGEVNVLRIDLSTFELREEGAFKDSGERYFPKITPVRGGVVIFGGWSTWRGVASGASYRRDGAFLPDDSSQWQIIKPTVELSALDGNLLVLRERDRIHFFGTRWNTWSLSKETWESHPRDVGSFFSKMRMALDADDQLIFWNPLSRDGFVIRW